MDRPPPFQARYFLPAVIDLGDWASIEPWFDALDRELGAVTDRDSMIAFLDHSGELDAALSEERSWRNIRSTCQTDDPEREEAYLHFISEIDPKIRVREFALAKKLIALQAFQELDRDRYLVLRRNLESEVALFRDENIPLFTEETRLCKDYEKICGAMTANWDGDEKTLARIGVAMEEPDRDRRRCAFEVIARRRMEDRDRLDALFDEMFVIRAKIASNAGFGNYRDFVFKRYGRFDYTPEDCSRFSESVAKHFVPLLRRVQSDQEKTLGVEKLKPWDLSVDPFNRPPLKPFSDPDELISRTAHIFAKMDDALAGDYGLMRDNGLLDLDNRKGKAPGGYQCTLAEARLPFIFMNAVGIHQDVFTLLHEAGHAFHALASRHHFPYSYRYAPIEFCEVASMSMEQLALDRLDEFYSEADHRRARQEQLKRVITIFPWIAQVDAFQHWIYLHPDHSRDDRTQAWIELSDRFCGIADWTGYEDARASLWHRQLHIFEMPFYYIEYGIAQIGALGIWKASKQDFKGTLQKYRHALSLGGSRPLPELFAAAGLEFDFSEATLAPLAQALSDEYERFKS